MDQKSSRGVRRTNSCDNCFETNGTNKKKMKSSDRESEENEELNGIVSHYFHISHTLDRLCVQFFESKTCIELSKALLGQILCRRLSPNGPILKGMIVETEAYLGTEDKACHTYGGRRTDRNSAMYLRSGFCYVYFTYGMYYCFNLSAEGEGAAVLIRAVQPLEGMDWMQTLRAESRKGHKESTTSPKFDYKLKTLCNGPSKLCMAFGINKDNTNKVDITDSHFIWIERADNVSPDHIVSAKRIGISRAEEWNHKELRFYIRNCEFVSHK